MTGIPGIAIANQKKNDAVETKITFNGGYTWSALLTNKDDKNCSVFFNLK